MALCALALCAASANPAWAKALSAKQIANKVLRLDPRKPADINLFTSKYANGADGFYPQGSAMHPASGPDPTEAQARAKLKSYLVEQFPNDTAKVHSALALFDGQQAKDMIPDPTLRAAFVGMRGTLLQPSISHLLNSGRFASPVRFGSIPQQGLIAITAGSGPRSIIFNNRYEREDFRYLVGIIGHEALHDDVSGPGSEEAVLNSLSAMTYLQVLSRHPEMAYTGTELSRQMNDLALVFLNTHERGSPNSEVYAPTGKGVAPASPRNPHDIWTIFVPSATAAHLPHPARSARSPEASALLGRPRSTWPPRRPSPTSTTSGSPTWAGSRSRSCCRWSR